MPAEALTGDPMSYRFYGYPRPGSIYRLPDNPRLVRGPTVNWLVKEPPQTRVR